MNFKRFFILFCVIFLKFASAFSQDIGNEVIDFSGKTLKNEEIKLSDYKGKVLILDFWASWCKPCKKEMPFLIDLYNEYKDKNFEIIAINVDTEKEKLTSFLSELNKEITFPIILDGESEIASKYNLDALPTSIIVDQNGIIKYKHIGFKTTDGEKIKAEVKSLLNEN